MPEYINTALGQFDEQIKKIPKGKNIVGFVSIRKEKDYQNIALSTEENLYLERYDEKAMLRFVQKIMIQYFQITHGVPSFMIGPDSYETMFC